MQQWEMKRKQETQNFLENENCEQNKKFYKIRFNRETQTKFKWKTVEVKNSKNYSSF